VLHETIMTLTNKPRSGLGNEENEVSRGRNDRDFEIPVICDADTLRTLIRKGTARVVDVRKSEDYLQEHIPTAVSLPLARLLENDVPQKVIDILQNLGISDKMPVVIYDDTFGALAARVAWTFQYAAIQIQGYLK